MAHHKRRRPKNARAGCLLCKPHKGNGMDRRTRAEKVAERAARQELESVERAKAAWHETFGSPFR